MSKPNTEELIKFYEKEFNEKFEKNAPNCILLQIDERINQLKKRLEEEQIKKEISVEIEKEILKVLLRFSSHIKNYDQLVIIGMYAIAMHDNLCFFKVFKNRKRDMQAHIAYTLLSKIQDTKCYIHVENNGELSCSYYACQKQRPHSLSNHFLKKIAFENKSKFTFLFPATMHDLKGMNLLATEGLL